VDESQVLKVLTSFTPRQKQVLLAVIDHQDTYLAAQHIGTTQRNVKAHMTVIYKALNIKCERRNAITQLVKKLCYVMLRPECIDALSDGV
jgi:DNA-binding NarL/FixJ family response regulator